METSATCLSERPMPPTPRTSRLAPLHPAHGLHQVNLQERDRLHLSPEPSMAPHCPAQSRGPPPSLALLSCRMAHSSWSPPFFQPLPPSPSSLCMGSPVSRAVPAHLPEPPPSLNTWPSFFSGSCLPGPGILSADGRLHGCSDASDGPLPAAGQRGWGNRGSQRRAVHRAGAGRLRGEGHPVLSLRVRTVPKWTDGKTAT